MAVGRPRAAQGGLRSLWWSRGEGSARPLPSVREPVRSLLATRAPRSVIRSATVDDLPLVRELWRAFELEVPEPDWRDDDSEHDSAELAKAVERDVVLLADDVGLAVATQTGARLGFLDILYVKPEARRTGIAAELVREAASRLRELGADTLELEVLQSNVPARGVYEHWGFAPVELTLAAPIDRLLGR